MPADRRRTSDRARRCESGISRRCLAKWYARWRAHGENGLLDHSSRPSTSPARTPEDLADLVEAQRRKTKHGPARLAADLRRLHGVTLADDRPPHPREARTQRPSPPAPANAPAPAPAPAGADTRTCIRRATTTPASPTRGPGQGRPRCRSGHRPCAGRRLLPERRPSHPRPTPTAVRRLADHHQPQRTADHRRPTRDVPDRMRPSPDRTPSLHQHLPLHHRRAGVAGGASPGKCSPPPPGASREAHLRICRASGRGRSRQWWRRWITGIAATSLPVSLPAPAPVPPPAAPSAAATPLLAGASPRGRPNYSSRSRPSRPPQRRPSPASPPPPRSGQGTRPGPHQRRAPTGWAAPSESIHHVFLTVESAVQGLGWWVSHCCSSRWRNW
ncbi:helix-turn-helix domain-containing protein [Streptomyces sp. NPDC001852]|uniref:helix-turn-helix domain-containing protein n=1 Tax=Streptomyces sp. NPDC001852 TaxID=3364619 RepID=UPI0036D15603